MYIALEGIDTSGKSTQLQALKNVFKEAIFTFEPGGTELGRKLRDILLEDSIILDSRTEMLLFLADRAELIAKVIKPNLHKLIISDRSLISGMAYAKDFDLEILKTFNLFATQGVLPNKVIFLELQEEELKRRLNHKENDKIELRGLNHLLESQKRFQSIIKDLSLHLSLQALTLDGALPREEITQKIIAFIEQ
ncbi:dTMP kinase [Helicobacter mesocricetorum]|uniref:dTMP kinase n=1 Tax=Helicobacter mesocricetorum TaxID=87012 RepID=UPI000CF09EBF|nr:dTMP kinase [Helicobacter mesocricetorum]